MNIRHATLGIAALLQFSCVGAQSLSLKFEGGRASLEAEAVSLQQVLQRWSNLTGAVVLGAEKISAPLLTLRVVATSERELLATLLRGIAGYVATERPESGGRITQIAFVDNDSSLSGLALAASKNTLLTGRKELTVVPMGKVIDQIANRQALERIEPSDAGPESSARKELQTIEEVPGS
jgi:hypothetical protein